MRCERYPKKFRIRRGSEYREVYAKGRRLVGEFVILHIKPNQLGHPRMGITVTRRTGKAVIRNRWKRMLREVFRRNRAFFPPFDIVVTVKKGCTLPHYRVLEKEILGIARRLK